MSGQRILKRRAAIGGMLAATSRRARAEPIPLGLATADTMNDTSYEVGQRFGAEVAKRSNVALTFLQARGMQKTDPDFKAFQDTIKTVDDQFSPRYPDLFKMITERNT
jgi:hypothetical protein